MELEKTQMLRELEYNNERIEKLEKHKTNEKLIKGEIFVNDESYVQDLENKVSSYKDRENLLLAEIEMLKSRDGGKAHNYPVLKSSSFGGAFKHVPEDPQEQAIFFFRKLLRAESYRKALIWQKRYLSLLIFSYQESELLSLGRLARMSGGRKMLIADIPRPEGRNVHFRLGLDCLKTDNS